MSDLDSILQLRFGDIELIVSHSHLRAQNLSETYLVSHIANIGRLDTQCKVSLNDSFLLVGTPTGRPWSLGFSRGGSRC